MLIQVIRTPTLMKLGIGKSSYMMIEYYLHDDVMRRIG